MPPERVLFVLYFRKVVVISYALNLVLEFSVYLPVYLELSVHKVIHKLFN